MGSHNKNKGGGGVIKNLLSRKQKERKETIRFNKLWFNRPTQYLETAK